MKGKIKIFITFMTTLFVIAGVVACGSTSKKEEVMEKDKIEQEQKTEQQEEKEVEGIKEEVPAETPTENVRNETDATQQAEERTYTEQPNNDQQNKSDTTEHSSMPITGTKPEMNQDTGYISDGLFIDPVQDE